MTKNYSNNRSGGRKSASVFWATFSASGDRSRRSFANASTVKLTLFDQEVEIRSLRRSIYADGNLAVLANIVWPDGMSEQEPISVNMAHGQPLQSKDLPEGEFFANTNEPRTTFVAALLAAGWIEQTGSQAPSGYLVYPAVRLTSKAILES